MIDDAEAGAMLRRVLTAQAASVTVRDDLAEQIVRSEQTVPTDQIRAEESGGPLRGAAPARIRPWLLPVLAAVVVSVLAGAVVVGIRLVSTSGNDQRRQLPGTASAITSPPSVQPGPTTTGLTSVSPSPVSTPSDSAGAPGGPVPPGFRAVDVTWISPSRGWALGTAPCATAPCTSIVRTSDGGRTWVGIPAPVAGLPGADCTGNCVSQLRFANESVGYAFGVGAMFLTVDGGRKWVREAGAVYALEISGSSVLRVVARNGCSPPGCTFDVQRAAVGSTDWQPVALPSGGRGTSVQLVRVGDRAVLGTFANSAGGSGDATAAIFTSSDNGVNWRARGEPCGGLSAGSGGVEVDSAAVSLALDGTMTVLCRPRAGAQRGFTITSTDDGATFGAAGAPIGTGPASVLATPTGDVQLAFAGGLYRSTDRGHSWARLAGPGGGGGSAAFLGFESATAGRTIIDESATLIGSATIWTTADAGASWTSYTFR